MRAGKWQGVLTPGKSREHYLSLAKKAMQADVVVFHRPQKPEFAQAAGVLKKIGKKIILDIDDTYKALRNAQSSPQTIAELQALMENFSKNADLVTVSTENLAKEYRLLGQKVVVLPNCVSSKDWPKPLRNKGKKVRVGLVGSVVYNSDFELIRKILARLSADPKIQLVFFSVRNKGVTGTAPQNQKQISQQFKIEAEWHNIVPMTKYIKQLSSLRLDIMLLPRQDNYFNRCKSNLKFLESSMLEIPVISQNLVTAEVEDGKYQKMCKNEWDWEKQIFNLINNKAARQNMGRAAREYVINKYDIAKNIGLWQRAYEGLFK